MKQINNLIFRTGYRCEKDPTGELDRKEKKKNKDKLYQRKYLVTKF